VVKRNRADDSVGSPHVKVGHCQAPNTEKALTQCVRAFLCLKKSSTAGLDTSTVDTVSDMPICPYKGSKK
ncbi:hypothetical protein Q4601_04315, partial [Shewanella sp. 1_MG-2023]|uniref:hypothetical protein n=1 Tax=Shewanella sp. 1_MG-2023 TaxID=3062629 RepID=UPI0026E2FAB9